MLEVPSIDSSGTFKGGVSKMHPQTANVIMPLHAKAMGTNGFFKGTTQVILVHCFISEVGRLVGQMESVPNG